MGLWEGKSDYYRLPSASSASRSAPLVKVRLYISHFDKEKIVIFHNLKHT